MTGGLSVISVTAPPPLHYHASGEAKLEMGQLKDYADYRLINRCLFYVRLMAKQKQKLKPT